MQNSFWICIIRIFKWTRVPFSHYKGEMSHCSSKSVVSARLQNIGNEICRLLKMAVKESLAVLHVLREANLSCQLKCTWQGEGNLLEALACPVAERFKIHLWGYFWALLEIPLKPDSLKPSNVLKSTEFPIPSARAHNIFCSANFPDFLMILMKGQVCMLEGTGALVEDAWALLGCPCWLALGKSLKFILPAYVAEMRGAISLEILAFCK